MPKDEDSPEERLRRELKARMRGDYRYMTGWDAECLQEAWREKTREYRCRYRDKHRERERVMQPIYMARWRAKQRREELPPLPLWDEASQSLEIPFE